MRGVRCPADLRWCRRPAVDLVELADELLGFGELAQIDLTLADEVEDELAEIREGVGALAVLADVVEARAAFAGAAFEHVADDARLRECGVDERAQRSSQLRRTEATGGGAAFACHDATLTLGFGGSDDGLPFTRVRRGAIGTTALFAPAAACTPVETVRPLPPVSGGKVRVRVFTEPSPVKSVTTVGKLVFVATESHVARWGREHSVMPLSP